MSAIPSTSANAYTNPYSSASSRSEEEEETSASADSGSAGKTAASSVSPEESQALNAYKQEILTRIKSLMQAPHLANVSLELGISDAGFKKMMGDSSYEKSVLDALEAKAAHSYTALDGTLSLSANGTDAPSARLEKRQTIAQRIFSGSSRALLRTLDIDALIAVADDSILAAKKDGGARFESAALLGANRMRTTAGAIDAYLKSLNSAVDSTG